MAFITAYRQKSELCKLTVHAFVGSTSRKPYYNNFSHPSQEVHSSFFLVHVSNSFTKYGFVPFFIISILSHIKHIIHAPYSTESKAIYFIQILSITIFRFFLMRNNAKLITPSRTINRIIKFKLILLSHPPANLWSITLESNFMMINAKSVTVIVTILLV